MTYQYRQSRGNKPKLHAVGEVIAGCTIIRAAVNATRTQRWHVTAACGHVDIIEGWKLREFAKLGRVMRCSPCRIQHGREQSKATQAAKAAARKGAK